MFSPSWERQGFTKKYDESKLVNPVQTNEIFLTEIFTYLSIRLEIFGWICIYIYIERESVCVRERERDRQTDRQNLALNNLQGLICHKTQATNQQSHVSCFFFLSFLTHIYLFRFFFSFFFVFVFVFRVCLFVCINYHLFLFLHHHFYICLLSFACLLLFLYLVVFRSLFFFYFGEGMGYTFFSSLKINNKNILKNILEIRIKTALAFKLHFYIFQPIS